MIIRIFLPESIYRLHSIVSSKCYNIFGKIVKDNSKAKVSIYIINVHESNDEDIANQERIGIISKHTNSNEKLPVDHILFGFDDTKPVLTIEAINLPSFIQTDDRLQTQAFLYDSKTFSELSQRSDYQILCQRIDPISQLILLIKNNDENKASKKSSDDRFEDKNTRSQLILILVSLSSFTETKFSFINSAFLKHFRFWATSLDKLTQKK